MTIEESAVEQHTEQLSHVDEAAAAAAAFASNRGEAPPVESQTSVEPVAQVDPDPVAPAQDAPKVLAGRTEAEIEALLGKITEMETGYRKQIDNLAGNYGKLNKAFQALQQQTPQGAAVEVTDEDMKEMQDQFPELAGMTKGVLTKLFGKLNLTGVAPAFDPEKVTSLVEQRVAAERVQTHKDLLNGLHPGWDKIIGMPDKATYDALIEQGKTPAEALAGSVPKTEYREWMAKQPDEYQQELARSNNAFVIGQSIKAFQEAKEAAAKRKKENEVRLKGALRPTGTAAAQTGISEQQAADAAFQARRKRSP